MGIRERALGLSGIAQQTEQRICRQRMHTDASRAAVQNNIFPGWMRCHITRYIAILASKFKTWKFINKASACGQDLEGRDKNNRLLYLSFGDLVRLQHIELSSCQVL